jgi:hypothetical protein
MKKVFNVLVPVVALVAADCERDAIDALTSMLIKAGFEPYEGDPPANAFESESEGRS